MSFIAHAGVLANLDLDSSWERFMVALESDIGDVQGGTTEEGIHLGLMSGTLDLIQRCYVGEVVRDGVLCFDPKPIDKLEGLSLPMRFRGTLLELGLEGGNLTVAAQADSFNRSVKVRVGDAISELKAAESHTFAL